MAKRTTDPEELKRRRAQKRLEALNYTPHTARFLSGVLRAMALNSLSQREARLQAFTDIANER